jgi:CheY-like chemotaxis protein
VREREVAIMQRSGYVAIVDDDAAMRGALARLLRVNGIKSRSYPSAHALLHAIAHYSEMPECLIVDVNMPEMTGIELQRELLDRGLRIPTIVVTACDDKSIAASAASLGATAFFLKPAPRDLLMTAINSAKKQPELHAQPNFDGSSVVVHWLDACRAGQLNALLDLYEARATLICDCDKINLIGRNSIAIYMKSKLENRATSAFTRAGMTVTGDEVQVDCQDCKGKPVHVRFRLSPSGKICHTRFAPPPCSV